MLLAVIALTASAAAEGRAAVPAGGHLRLRVLSYNIHHVVGVDGKLDLPRIAGVNKSVKPDPLRPMLAFCGIRV